MKTVCIVQARTTSSRFPNKVMADLCGKPVLQHVLDRCLRSQLVDELIILTPNTMANDIIATTWHQLPIFRGEESETLSGYYGAALLHHAEVIVRITADCPLVQPNTIDDLIQLQNWHNLDYVSNEGDCLGFDAEVFTFPELEKAYLYAYEQYDRVHTTPRIRRTAARQIAFKSQAASYRLCVDEPPDLEMIRRIVEHLGPAATSAEIFQLLGSHPELICNAHVRQKVAGEL